VAQHSLGYPDDVQGLEYCFWQLNSDLSHRFGSEVLFIIVFFFGYGGVIIRYGT
jgi:hypothetical protein